MKKDVRTRLAEKKWQEAGLTNDFIFNKVFLEVDLAQELLQRIFPQMDLGNILLLNSQQEFKTTFEAKTARFDIYVESSNNYQFDLEMQVRNYHDLFQRNLYYLSSMISDSMEHHQNYGEMGNSYVIFFCNFDPFGDDDQYTSFEFRNLRHLKRSYGENAKVMFFDLNSKKREVNPLLQNFIDFVAGREVEKEDEFIVQLRKRIDYVKQNRKWRLEFMRRSIYEMDIENEKKWAVREGREEGLKKGIQEGREKGRQEGRQEGRKEGRQEGRREARQEGILALISSLRSLGINQAVIKQQLAENYHLTDEEIKQYLDQDK